MTYFLLKNGGKGSRTSEAIKRDYQFMLQRYLWSKLKNDTI